MSGLVLRATFSRAYRSGSEVITADTGPLQDLDQTAAEIASRIAAVLDRHGDEISRGGMELLIRVSAGSFAPVVPRLPPRSRRRSGWEF
jgi:hypothetical protein